ncbi:FKBP-type peptidyl-prolyl cis-trans isomerase [Pseudomonas palmensis]|uniref:FKBP-type peptidyl-prolyl cis-trans isomerase n=1 Tax=Pseudomonas palmensis TaxID=2815362 RepID=UPI0039ED91EE
MGVQKVTLEEGKGESPKIGQTVSMHYTGWLQDLGATDRLGKKFDSSRDRGKPFQLKIGVGTVIKGLDEGVLQMSVGEKAKLFITSDYAYGPHGHPDVIPPNANLIFEVELLSIL